jgi:hypothetical protein
LFYRPKPTAGCSANGRITAESGVELALLLLGYGLGD